MCRRSVVVVVVSVASLLPSIALAGPPLAVGTAGVPALSGDDLRMKALESEVDALKEKVFSSKARLLQLQEVSLHGAAAGAIARIKFKNDMGGAYKLEAATWVLDGQTIYSASLADAKAPVPVPEVSGSPLLKGDAPAAPAVLDDRQEQNLFDGAIVPGSHNLVATLVYRGAGYKLFTYVEPYRFTVQSQYAFLVEEGKTTELEVAASPKPGLSHSYENRIDVRFALSSKDSVLPAAESKP